MDTIPDSTPQKQCTRCKKWMDKTPVFFFRMTKSKDGLQSQCKNCIGTPRDPVPYGHKRCKKCGNTWLATLDFFFADKREDDGLRCPCKQCIKNYREENKKAVHDSWQKFYRANHERMLLENRERNHRYGARKDLIEGTFTSQQIQDLLKRQKYRCYYAACGHAKFEKVNGKHAYHIEHTYPLNRVVGTTIPANDINYLVLACKHCNCSKRDKFPWEWPEGGRLL